MRFIILFYNEYFKVYGKDKEKKENEKDKKEEQISLSDIELKVYSNFINTQFCNIVENIREFYKISNNFLNSWGFHEVSFF